MKEGQKLWTREEFMAFFRNDESLQTLTADDRIEIFSQILTGSSDFTEELIGAVLADYCVSGIRVIGELKIEDGI